MTIRDSNQSSIIIYTNHLVIQNNQSSIIIYTNHLVIQNNAVLSFTQTI